MAQRLGFGESIPTLGIKRCDIGPGYTGYFIPLVRDVLAKQIAYVSGFGSVEVDQASMIEFKLNPTNYYFLLVARLDTDIQSVQATLRSESITVEYIRLTQSQYQDYLRAWEVNPQAQAVSFTKETRKNKDGKDVSSLKYTLAGFNITPGIAQRLEQLRAQPEVIDRLFQEVDATTSQSVENYRKWLSSQAGGVGSAGYSRVGSCSAASSDAVSGTYGDALSWGFTSSGYSCSALSVVRLRSGCGCSVSVGPADLYWSAHSSGWRGSDAVLRRSCACWSTYGRVAAFWSDAGSYRLRGGYSY